MTAERKKQWTKARARHSAGCGQMPWAVVGSRRVESDASKRGWPVIADWYCAHSFGTSSVLGRAKVSTSRLPNAAQLGQIWVQEHRAEFAGQWVALEGATLVASGKDAREVYRTAIKKGVELPFLVRVEPEDGVPFGGW